MPRVNPIEFWIWNHGRKFNGVVIVIEEIDGDVVNAGVDTVNDVFEHHGEVEVVTREERGVPGDVLSNLPEDSTLSRLGCASTEKLGAAKPQAGYTVVLFTSAFGAELEYHVGPRGGAIGRWGVADGERGGVDGVGEGVT